MPAWLSTLGFAMGSAWLSGINLYATVFTLGILERLGLATLPGDLKVLEKLVDYRRGRFPLRLLSSTQKLPPNLCKQVNQELVPGYRKD